MNMRKLEFLMLIVGILIILSSFAALNYAVVQNSPGSTNENQYNGSLDEGEVLSELYTLINVNRGDRGMNTLQINNNLETMAEYKANNMKSKNYISHTSPSGSTVDDRFERFNIECSNKGENLAQTYYMQEVDVNYGSTSLYTSEEELAEGINKQFMASQSHKNNILSEDYSEYGLGLSITEEGKVYVVQEFCG